MCVSVFVCIVWVVYAWEHERGCASCGLVPLAEGGATVGTPSLAQREAEEEPEGEEEDGTQDPQAGEVILQDTDSATHTHTQQEHRYRI